MSVLQCSGGQGVLGTHRWKVAGAFLIIDCPKQNRLISERHGAWPILLAFLAVFAFTFTFITILAFALITILSLTFALLAFVAFFKRLI